MARDTILVIDQGTTSTRTVAYDARLAPLGQAQVEIPLGYPKPGWVEHDPDALIASVRETIRGALADAKVEPERIAGIGITNQRETTLIWDRSTGKAIHPALVWQDRRTAPTCAALADHGAEVSRQTGLLIDPYFSATKMAWILDNVPGARARAEAGELIAGTVDSWLIWHLSGGKRHVIDVTNASRTLLMDLRGANWSEDLCRLFAVPPGILPEIIPSSGRLAETSGFDSLPDGIAIAGIAGDQQASLVGQGCLEPGQAKCTYGTGAFLLVHTGEIPIPSRHGLITTVAASLGDGPLQYAMEGSVFVAGAAVQWFRDGLKAIGASSEINPLSLGADPNAGVLFVPALTGLGAPYWRPEARGTIFGITRATTIADLARATLEGVGYQVADLVHALEADRGSPLAGLRVDGGMARSDPFLQFQADLLGLTVERSPNTESTALGAAVLAGLGAGLFDREGAVALLHAGRTPFRPRIEDDQRGQMMRHWRHAVATVTRHYQELDLP